MYKIPNPESFRKNVKNKIKNVLDTSKIVEEDMEGNKKVDDEKISINLEKGVYNYAIKEANDRKIIKKWENPYFVQIYIDRLRSIYINLKNPELIQQIKSGEITPQILAFMTHQEMNPEVWRKLLDEKIKRDANKFANNMQASTDMFTCKKCKSKRCTYYELQTRSADEPATIDRKSVV
jgi:DNA-directed RNA polymerase subunit M/transcription elongation factor TFIIS